MKQDEKNQKNKVDKLSEVSDSAKCLYCGRIWPMRNEVEADAVREHVMSCVENPVLVALRVTKARADRYGATVIASARSKHDEATLTISFTYRNKVEYKHASEGFIDMLKSR